MNSYKIITEPCEGEIVEKKSKFIANIIPVQSKEEALQFQASIKKKHYDARHHCMGYIIGEDVGYSDDGEPQGTAGKPILEVLKGAGVTNLVCVVTRYFGGILLGTGGLVRAYTDAAKDAMSNARIATMIPGARYVISCDYSHIGKFQNLFAVHSATVENTEYTDSVKFSILVSCENEQRLLNQIKEATAATIIPEKIEDCFFPSLDTL